MTPFVQIGTIQVDFPSFMFDNVEFDARFRKQDATAVQHPKGGRGQRMPWKPHSGFEVSLTPTFVYRPVSLRCLNVAGYPLALRQLISVVVGNPHRPADV